MDNITYNFSNLVVRTANNITYKEVLFMPFNTEIMMTMIMSIILSWFFHEAIHYIKANEYKLKPYYGWDHKGSFVSIKIPATKHQHKRIIESGVIMGSLPIIITTFWIGLWSIIPLMLYVLGCHTDIKKILKEDMI